MHFSSFWPILVLCKNIIKKQIRELTDDVKSFLILCETDKMEEASGGEESKSASDSDEEDIIKIKLYIFYLFSILIE